MSTNYPITRTRIFLNGPKDWDEWIMLLESSALRYDIWQYVNPATPKDQLPRLIEPVRPTPTSVRELNIDGPYESFDTPAQNQTPTEAGNPKPIAKSMLTELEKDKLEELLDEYAHDYEKYLAQDQAYGLLRVRIQESVRREFLLAYCKEKDLYDMLVTLQNRFAQTAEHKEMSSSYDGTI